MKQFPVYFMLWPWVAGVVYHLLSNDATSAIMLMKACVLFWVMTAPLVFVAFQKGTDV